MHCTLSQNDVPYLYLESRSLTRAHLLLLFPCAGLLLSVAFRALMVCSLQRQRSRMSRSLLEMRLFRR